MTFLVNPYALKVTGIAPTDIVWSGTHTVIENSALGTVVGGALSVTDPDVGDTVTYTITDSDIFAISGTNVIVIGLPDYETATSHDITIRATDGFGNTYDEVFAITVTDVDEEPPDLPPEDGTIIIDVPGTFDIEPTVGPIDGGIKFSGKKKTGASGKFIFDLGPAQAGKTYAMRYDPDWSLLENGGVTAMVSFGLRDGNDFRLSGLQGDGASGLNAHEVYGDNKWNQTTGFTTVDGGAAANGTQDGPNWLMFAVSEDGLTYTLRSSSDGIVWTDEFTDVVPSPFADVDGVASFGIAVFLQVADAGPFHVDITFWEEAVSVIITPRQAMLGSNPPIFVNIDDARDAMVPGAMVNKRH